MMLDMETMSVSCMSSRDVGSGIVGKVMLYVCRNALKNSAARSLCVAISSIDSSIRMRQGSTPSMRNLMDCELSFT